MTSNYYVIQDFHSGLDEDSSLPVHDAVLIGKQFWWNLQLSSWGNYFASPSNLNKASTPTLEPTKPHFSGYRKFFYPRLIDRDVKLTTYHNLVLRLTMRGATPPQPAPRAWWLIDHTDKIYLKMEADSRFLFDKLDACLPNYTVAQSRRR